MVRVQTVRSTPRQIGLQVNKVLGELQHSRCVVRSIQFIPPFEEDPGRTVAYAQIVFEFPTEDGVDPQVSASMLASLSTTSET